MPACVQNPPSFSYIQWDGTNAEEVFDFAVEACVWNAEDMTYDINPNDGLITVHDTYYYRKVFIPLNYYFVVGPYWGAYTGNDVRQFLPASSFNTQFTV